MRLLILGGTVFLGPHVVDAARARGARVTVFHRGRHPSDAPDVERVTGDRNAPADLEALAARGPWDAVVDTCGYVPRHVRSAAAALANRAGRYAFVSSLSVYEKFAAASGEDAPLAAPVAANVETVTGETYGALKAACEDAARNAFGDRALVLRPGFIVGPRDPSDRYTYWVRRVADGGRMLAPGDGSRRVQFVDVRDIAAFIVDLLLRDAGGTFNVTGSPTRFDDFLAGVAAAAGTVPGIRWIPEATLLARSVQPWVDLPLWIAGEDQVANCDRALAAGLRLRDPVETARATWQWDRTRDRSKPLAAGLSREREDAILASE